MQQSNAFFATAKPSRLFFKVALPGGVSMLAMSIYSIIEGIFIGQILGEAAFAAINLAMPFVMINFSLADLVGVGSSVPISIALGRKDYDRANRYFTASLLLIFGAAVFMGLILYFLSPFLVSLLGAEGQVAVLTVKYVRVYAMFGPVCTVVFAMDNYLRICGFVKGSMVLNIFMSLFTAGLLALFFVLFPMWDVYGFGVEGSALATSISMSVCALVAFIPFFRKKTVLKFVKPKIDGYMLKEIVCCGAPVFLNNIAGRVASMVLNSALLSTGGPVLGETAVAAYSVMMYASDIVQPLIYGMSDSVQPALGYNWGAGDRGRVRSIAKCSFAACGAVSLVGSLVMLLFPETICSLFIKAEETALMEMSVAAMRIFSTAHIFRWVGFSVQGLFSAVEKSLFATILSVSSAMVFPIIFVYALSPLGLDGLWLNMTATAVMVAILAVILLKKSGLFRKEK